MDWSVAFTLKVSVANWLTVSDAGAVKTGGTCFPMWTVTVADRVRDPVEPIMTTVKVPTVAELTLRIVLPDSVMDSTLRVVKRLVGLEAMTVTFPWNPFTAFTVIVEVPVALTFSEMEAGLADREKS